MNREFKRGFKSVFSFTNDDRTRKRIPELSTEDRIRQSWNSVGNDLKKSMGSDPIALNLPVNLSVSSKKQRPVPVIYINGVIDANT